VRNSDHAIVGTPFDPLTAKVGNEELESWLLRLLDPKIAFHFFKVPFDGDQVIVLEISRAARHPVRF
jgi:predicted HTH transcriptional regulator